MRVRFIVKPPSMVNPLSMVTPPPCFAPPHGQLPCEKRCLVQHFFVLFAGFAMNVISLLPYLVEHFEEPNTTCSEVAEHIAQVSSQ